MAADRAHLDDAQSNATAAAFRTGLPVPAPTFAGGKPVDALDAGSADKKGDLGAACPSVLMQNTPLRSTAGLVWLRRLGYTSSVGGASVTDGPQSRWFRPPAGPQSWWHWTAAPSRLMASRKPPDPCAFSGPAVRLVHRIIQGVSRSAHGASGANERFFLKHLRKTKGPHCNGGRDPVDHRLQRRRMASARPCASTLPAACPRVPAPRWCGAPRSGRQPSAAASGAI